MAINIAKAVSINEDRNGGANNINSFEFSLRQLKAGSWKFPFSLSGVAKDTVEKTADLIAKIDLRLEMAQTASEGDKGYLNADQHALLTINRDKAVKAHNEAISGQVNRDKMRITETLDALNTLTDLDGKVNVKADADFTYTMEPARPRDGMERGTLTNYADFGYVITKTSRVKVDRSLDELLADLDA